jgi:outer membrane protein assembly factor BamB
MKTHGGLNVMSKCGIFAALLAAGILMVSTSATAADWPCFRGSNRDARTDEKVTKWPPVELWRADIGQGFSQVLVSQGKVYTFGWSNNQNTVKCFSESSTGTNPAPLWATSYTCAAGNHAGGLLGTYSTHAVSGGKVYTYDNFGLVSCFDAANGNSLWTSTALSGGGPEYGSSPLIEGNLLIVNGGDANGAAAISLTAPHNLVWGSTGGARYSSPIVATIGTQRTIIGAGSGFMNGNATGLDPSGNVLWSFT